MRGKNYLCRNLNQKCRGLMCEGEDVIAEFYGTCIPSTSTHASTAVAVFSATKTYWRIWM